MEKLEEIRKLKSLLDQGAITQDEFTTLKKNLLAENKGASGLDLSSVNNETVTGKKATKKVLLPEDKLAQKEAKKTLRQMDLDVVQWNLIYFIQANESQTVKLLLGAGLNPNSAFYDEKQKRNFYALHQAARFSEPDIIQILIDCGAKINLQDDNGYTPLFYAIEVGKNNNLKVLIEKGADLNHKNKAGINPLYYAKKHKKPEILDLLLRAGAKEMPIDEIKSIERGKLLKKILIAAAVIGFCWFVGNAIFSASSDSSSSSNSSGSTSTESANDDDKFVRDYIISHRYVVVENGVSFTLKFSDSRGGWFGIMRMDMGSCWSLYQYETKGRSINLKFDSSNCTSQGDSRTATFNNDNTISFNINGQNFVFQPL